MTTPLASLIFAVLSLSVVWSCPGATRTRSRGAEVQYQLKVGALRQIQLPPGKPLTREEVAEIKRRIRNLARISNPDVGLSPSFSGSAFAPIAKAREVGAMLLTSHKVETSPDFVELVKLGPKALPFLLAAIDDHTATKLVIPSHQAFGIMSFRNELSGNPANLDEVAVIDSAPEADPLPSDQPPASYTVKVGDVCFVIIGQIVGRAYSAVRYQPSGNIVINSPPGEKSLVTRVRTIWSHEPARQFLLNSLLLDYATEATGDGHRGASYFQCSATMRLLYYYPQESSQFVAERLQKLNVQGGRKGSVYSGEQLEYWQQRERANGVRTASFVKAVAWCRQPVVLKEVRSVFERTTDAEIALITADAMNQSRPGFVLKRLAQFISEQPQEERGPFGDGYNLLIKLGELSTTNAKPTFLAYIETDTLQRRRTMCHVLRKTRGEWSVELLSPFLNDTRSADGWTYPIISGQNEPRREIRICDEAAETIAGNFPKLAYKMEGEHANLDRQIERMRNQIAHHQY